MSFPYPYHWECHRMAKCRSRFHAANLFGSRRVHPHSGVPRLISKARLKRTIFNFQSLILNS